jgi:phosphoribosylanthranilate isomerase
MKIQIKVCGMTDEKQVLSLTQLGVNYVGFIFYPKSPRAVDARQPIESPLGLQRVGVFVDEPLESVLAIQCRWRLDVLQLHGKESPEYVALLKAKGLRLIKVFGIEKAEDFENCTPYNSYCDYFLFDTKGPAKGGNGFAFDWSLLQHYKGTKPYFLSGGIGPEAVEAIAEIQDPRLFALDLNSRFEERPGIKQLEKLGTFINQIC